MKRDVEVLVKERNHLGKNESSQEAIIAYDVNQTRVEMLQHRTKGTREELQVVLGEKRPSSKVLFSEHHRKVLTTRNRSLQHDRESKSPGGRQR
jgi:hypothetical protein